MRVAVATLAALSYVSVVSADTEAQVVDGDGFRIGGQAIRLVGIDAPERGQPCGSSSGVIDCGTQMVILLRRDIQSTQLTCRDTGERSFKRIVAQCELGGEDLGLRLIREGRAMAHPDHAKRAYFKAERVAKREGIGLWAYQMQPPWEYRAALRLAAFSATPSQAEKDCPVKGNISRGGERIYHVAGQRDYSKVKITAARGERCFSDEPQALKAGWRKAQR
ncbi:MAG: thermonuclease family protein [Marinovum sp.]|nr:thermonuclease family protein [Marinovum sp.]